MSTIEVIALKPFVYSEDGYTEISIDEKQVFQAPERFFNGWNDARMVRRTILDSGWISMTPQAEKPIEPIVRTMAADETVTSIIGDDNKDNESDTAVTDAGKKPVEAVDVEIPNDWKSLKWFALRSLASKVSDTPIKTAEDATAAIEAYLASRS